MLSFRVSMPCSLVLWDRVFLYGPEWPGMDCVNPAGFELRDLCPECRDQKAVLACLSHALCYIMNLTCMSGKTHFSQIWHIPVISCQVGLRPVRVTEQDPVLKNQQTPQIKQTEKQLVWRLLYLFHWLSHRSVRNCQLVVGWYLHHCPLRWIPCASESHCS